MASRRLDIKKALGSSLPAGTYPIALFIPSRDRDGKPIDREYWTREGLRVLGNLFRGATGLPGYGVWRDDSRGGALVEEEPVVIFCLADPSEITAMAARELRRFLHQLGRETNQGEVGAIIEGQYWGITRYDTPEA